MTNTMDTGWPGNMGTIEEDAHFNKLFDLYGLGVDIADISFDLWDISTDNLPQQDPSLPTPIANNVVQAPNIPRNNKRCAEEAQLDNIEQFQQAEQLMFSPQMYAHDQLAFSDYMMVHCNSGEPALSAEGSPFVEPIFANHWNRTQPQHAVFNFHSLPPSPVDSNVGFFQPPRAFSSYNNTAGVKLKKCKTSPEALVCHRSYIPDRKYSGDFDMPKENLTVDFDNLWSPADQVFSDEDDEVEDEGRSEDVGKAGKKKDKTEETGEKVYLKPPYSYSSLVAMALKNSRNGRMTVRDIYNFMCNHFPYFRTAAVGWKNSVRHNLSLNPAFLKIVAQAGPARARIACRWTINPERYNKVTDEIAKHRDRSLDQILQSMRDPELLKDIEEGSVKDFTSAIKGVIVEEKRPGGRRSRSPKKPKNLPGSPPSLMKRPVKAASAVAVPQNQRAFREANSTPFIWGSYHNPQQKATEGMRGQQGSFLSQKNFSPYGRTF